MDSSVRDNKYPQYRETPSATRAHSKPSLCLEADITSVVCSSRSCNTNNEVIIDDLCCLDIRVSAWWAGVQQHNPYSNHTHYQAFGLSVWQGREFNKYNYGEKLDNYTTVLPHVCIKFSSLYDAGGRVSLQTACRQIGCEDVELNITEFNDTSGGQEIYLSHC